MRYSTLILIGPLRGVSASSTFGSVQRFSGSTSSSARAGSGSRRPTVPAATIAAEAQSRACAGPCTSATVPQSQLPSAMPPKAAV